MWWRSVLGVHALVEIGFNTSTFTDRERTTRAPPGSASAESRMTMGTTGTPASAAIRKGAVRNGASRGVGVRVVSGSTVIEIP